MTGWPARAGWPALVAIAAAGAALSIQTAAVPRWRAQLADAAVVPAVAPRRPVDPPSVVPDTGSTASRAADLLENALRHGLRIESASQSRDDGGGIERLRIVLVAHGDYASLRAFIESSLLADAGLALDRLQWRRAAESAAVIDAELQWSLLRPPAPPR